MVTSRSKILATIVLLLVGYFLYRERLPIEAKIWHLRYGNSLRASEYEIPVPSEWLVRRLAADGSLFLLVDTMRTSGETRATNAPTILISIDRFSPPDLDAWQSMRKSWLMEHGMANLGEKRLQSDALTVVCLSGHEFRDVMHVRGFDAVTADCMSTGHISLTFNGDDASLQKLYGIIGGIHKLA